MQIKITKPIKWVHMFPVSLWILKMLLKQDEKDGMGGLWKWDKNSFPRSHSGSSEWERSLLLEGPVARSGQSDSSYWGKRYLWAGTNCMALGEIILSSSIPSFMFCCTFSSEFFASFFSLQSDMSFLESVDSTSYRQLAKTPFLFSPWRPTKWNMRGKLHDQANQS